MSERIIYGVAVFIVVAWIFVVCGIAANRDRRPK